MKSSHRDLSLAGGAVFGLLAVSTVQTELAPADQAAVRERNQETAMDEETFNLSIRKFLKMVGVSSQREIEQAVAKAIADGVIAGTETFPASVTLEIAELKLSVRFDGDIKLQ